MKFKSKPSNKASSKSPAKEAPTTKTTSAKKASPKSSGKPEISKENFDSGICYIGIKPPTVTIRKHAVSLVIPEKMHAGFLIVTGAKGVLVHAVEHADDVYCRTDAEGKKSYGSIEAFKSANTDAISAELVDLAGLRKLANSLGKAAKVVRQSDKYKFDVCYLADPGASYVPAVTRVGGKLVVLNTEPVRAYNKKPVQFIPEADLDFKKTLAVTIPAK